jgi:hypothetical protein
MCDLLERACSRLGRPVVTEGILQAGLGGAGFVGVVVRSFKQPYGPWAKDGTLGRIGAMVLLAAESGAEGYGMVMFTRVLGMSSEEAKEACQDCARDIKNRNHHSYSPQYVISHLLLRKLLLQHG